MSSRNSSDSNPNDHSSSINDPDGILMEYMHHMESNSSGSFHSNRSSIHPISELDASLIQYSHRGYIDEVLSLLSQGANVNAQDEDRESPLTSAALQGHDEIIKLLLSRGANIDHQNTLGNTALMLAAMIDDLASAIVLIEHGANIDITGNDGDTALDMTDEQDAREIKSILKKIKGLKDMKPKTLDKLFNKDPFFWTTVSKKYSRNAFEYFTEKYSRLLKLPKDIIKTMF